jgi:hypothetical protein
MGQNTDKHQNIESIRNNVQDSIKALHGVRDHGTKGGTRYQLETNEGTTSIGQPQLDGGTLVAKLSTGD